MSNKLNPFEEQLRQAANSHEVPYDASQWDRLERQLDQKSFMQKSSAKWGLSAVAVLVIGLGIYYITNNHDAEPVEFVKQTKEVIIPAEENKTLVEKSVEADDKKVEEKKNVIEEAKKDIAESKASKVVFHKPVLVEKKVEEPTIVVEEVKDQITNQSELIETEVITELEKNVIIPNIVLPQKEICAGVELIASLDEYESEEVIWYLGNGETIEEKDLKYTYLNDGDYTIKAFLPNINVYTEPVNITVHPKPDAQFSYIENIERGAIPVVYFSANTGGEKYYSWTLGDGHTVRAEGVAHTYRKNKDYEISLRVMNKYGCFWTSYQRYSNDKEYNLLAPNSFSPNSDGTNDMWFPKSLTTGYYNFELVVYDRDHKEVFRTSDPNVQFDGRVNGTKAPSGEMFIWKADVVDPGGIRQEFGGTIISIY
jgi:gliding motility-associated-like protein